MSTPLWYHFNCLLVLLFEFLTKIQIPPSVPANKVDKPKGFVVGQMRVKGFDIKVWFFGYSLRDPAWANFTLESYPVIIVQL